MDPVPQGEASRRESDEVGPDTELEYWRNRMAKFNSITEQLKSKAGAYTRPLFSST